MAMGQPDPRETELRTDHLTIGLKVRTVRGGTANATVSALGFLLSIMSTMILARLLTPEDFGLVAMVTAFVAFVELFKDLGLSTATIQKETLTHAQSSTLFWVNTATGAALGLLLAALSWPIASFYREPRLIAVTLVLALGLPLGGIAIQHHALLRRQMRFVALAGISGIELLVAILTGIVMALLGAGYWALVLARLAGQLASVMSIWTICKWRPGAPVLGSGVRSMLAFGGNLTGFNLVNFTVSRIDSILVGRMWGGEALGAYDRAQSLLLVPLRQVNEPLSAVAMPALSRLTGAPERYRAAYLGVLDKVLLLSMPGIAFLIGTSDWVVELVLGRQWAATSRIFIAFAVSGLLLPMANTTGWLFVTQARTRQMFHWGLVDSVIKLCCFMVGLRWGPLGLAMGHAARVLIATPLLISYVGREGPVRALDLYRAIAPFLLCALSSILAICLFRVSAPQVGTIPGLAAAFGITLVSTLVILAILPAGRRSLRDAYQSAMLLRRQSA